MHVVLFVLLGYVSGSVLYARVFANVFHKEKMLEQSDDRNPGSFNAFKYGGLLCGVCTLVCDILKGFLPVFVYVQYCRYMQMDPVGLGCVLAAPVVGHAFPILYRFKGGKGIAATFGCLLGLFPMWLPLAGLAVFFIFFSVVLKITPHFHRTVCSYLGSLVYITYCVHIPAVTVGFMIITATVCIRMRISPEEKEKMRVRFLWTH